MSKLFGLFTLFFLMSFVKDDNGRQPRLTELKVEYDHDACSAPLAIFDITHAGDILSFSFGYNVYLEKQDTITFLFRDDSLFLSITKRNKPRVVVRNGVPDTVYRRDDPDCECNSLVSVKFSGVSKKPKSFLIDQYIHDETFGLVAKYHIVKLREAERAPEKTGKFKLDSLFEVKPEYKSYPNLQDLPSYLDNRGTLALIAVDVDTHAERQLVERIQRLLFKKNLICESRTQTVLQKDFYDQDSTSVWVKLTDTKGFKFPEYRKRKK